MNVGHKLCKHKRRYRSMKKVHIHVHDKSIK